VCWARIEPTTNYAAGINHLATPLPFLTVILPKETGERLSCSSALILVSTKKNLDEAWPRRHTKRMDRGEHLTNILPTNYT